jgi:hypothetical protein
MKLLRKKPNTLLVFLCSMHFSYSLMRMLITQSNETIISFVLSVILITSILIVPLFSEKNKSIKFSNNQSI